MKYLRLLLSVFGEQAALTDDDLLVFVGFIFADTVVPERTVLYTDFLFGEMVVDASDGAKIGVSVSVFDGQMNDLLFKFFLGHIGNAMGQIYDIFLNMTKKTKKSQFLLKNLHIRLICHIFVSETEQEQNTHDYETDDCNYYQ